VAPRTLNVTFAADSSGVGKAFDQIEGKASSMGDKMSSVGAKLTAGITLPLVAVGVKAFTMAADAEDATSAMNVVFGKSSDVISQWSKNAATSMGLTSTEAKKAATDLAIFGKAGGLAGKDLTDFATQQSQLSADLASFKGTSVEEAMTAIGAAYRGETEPIRAYGVLLDAQKIKDEAVSLGLAKQGEELDNNAKLLATRSLIMKATADQQGDFARTSDGAANKMKILSAQIKEQVTAIGGQLIPIGQKLLGVVSGWLSKFSELGPAGQRMALMIAGIAAAVGPVLIVVGKMIQSFGILKDFIKGFSFNPWILGIGLAIAALVLLWQHSEKFREIVTNAFNFVMQVFRTFTEMWNNPDITSSGLFGAIEGIVMKVRQAFDGLLAWWRGIWPQFSEAVSHVWNVIQGIVAAGAAIVGAMWRLWGDDLLVVLRGVWNVISGVVSGALQIISGIIKTVLAVINGDWSRAGEGMKQIVRGLGTALQALFQGAMTAIRGTIGAGFDAIMALMRSVPGRILSSLGNPAGLLVAAGRAIMSGLLSGIASAWNSVASYLSGIAAKIRSLKGPIEKDRKLLIPEGRAIMEGFESGLRKQWGSVEGFLSDATAGISGSANAAVTASSGAQRAGGNGQMVWAPQISGTFVGIGGMDEVARLLEQKFYEMLRSNGHLKFA
jgi:phage-related protein